MYASTSARRASASIRRAPSRTISSITDDAADRAAPEPSRSAESETTVSIGSYLPDQRCRAGLAWNLSSVTPEGTPHPKPIHRFQALLHIDRGAQERCRRRTYISTPFCGGRTICDGVATDDDRSI